MATYNCAADLVGKTLAFGDQVNFYCGPKHGMLSYQVTYDHLSRLARDDNNQVFQVLGLCDKDPLDGANNYLRDNVDPSFTDRGCWPTNTLDKQTLAVRHLFALCEGRWGKPEVPDDYRPLLDFFKGEPFGCRTPTAQEFAAILVELIGKADSCDLDKDEANDVAARLRSGNLG